MAFPPPTPTPSRGHSNTPPSASVARSSANAAADALSRGPPAAAAAASAQLGGEQGADVDGWREDRPVGFAWRIVTTHNSALRVPFTDDESVALIQALRSRAFGSYEDILGQNERR